MKNQLRLGALALASGSLFSLGLSSCQQDKVTELPAPIAINSDMQLQTDSMFVSLTEASEVALNAFTDGAPSTQQGTAVGDGSQEVKSNQKPKKKAIQAHSVVREEGGPAFYVFNYKGRGLVHYCC